MSEAVLAEIAYLNSEWKNRDELARIYSRETRKANTSKREILVHNARPRAEANDLDLDTNGFILIKHETAFTDFENKPAIERDYFREMRLLALELTDAHDAVIFPFYQVRSRRPANFFDAYALYMHCDFTPNHWLDQAQRILADNGRADLYPSSEWDYALYNLWRPISHTAEKDPLTLVDASTMNADDILEYWLAPEGDTSLAALPVHNEGQRHYYFPNMQTDEVLVFKQQDSREGVARVCPHTSFVDPTSRQDAPDRHSIEVRVVCAFPKTA